MENTIVAYLLESTAMFAILFTCIWLVRKAFKKQLSAVMQYALWGIVILKLLIPIGLPSTVSPMNLILGSQPAMVQNNNQANSIDPLQADEPDTQAMQTSAIQNDTAYIPEAPTTMPDTAQAQPKAPFTPITLNWEMAVTGVWLAGMLGMGVWLAICAARMKRRMTRKDPIPVPENILRTLLSCKRALGIKRNIRISMQQAFPIPAIMGIFKPVLILPAELLHCEDEHQIKHVMMHELVHYKHGDIAIICLLNILNTVYWFNPLVWLAIRLIRKDMETVCDTTVLKLLGKGRRQAYIDTILHFTEKNNAQRLQAALSISDERTQMKKRIEGMYMKRRTKHSVRITVILLACLMAFTCFTTACQPTPDKPVIVGKNDGQLQQKIAQSAAPEGNYDAPKAWNEELKDETLDATLTINAPVDMHGVAKYPIYRIKPINFTQEEIDRFIHYFVGDAKLYNSENIPLTRTQLQNEILRNQAELEKLKQTRPYDLQDSEERKTLEDWINQAKEKLKTAPETVNKQYIDSKFSINSDGGEELSAFADMGNQPPVRIVLFNMMKDYYSDMFSIGADESKTFPALAFNQRFDGTALSDERASELAKQLLSELGIKEMEITELKKGMNAFFDPSKKDDIRVVLRPTVNGLPIRAKCVLTMEEKEYAPQMGSEEITVDMDPAGIQGFAWSDRGKITETANENVQLMPFEQIQEKFRQQIFKQPIWAMGEEGKKLGGSQSKGIDRIELGLVNIPEKDRPGSFLLIPAWNFYSTEMIPDGITKRMTGEEKRVQCIMTINAVDGSIITRS